VRDHQARSEWWRWERPKKLKNLWLQVPSSDLLEEAAKLHRGGASWRRVQKIIAERYPDVAPSARSRTRLAKMIDGDGAPERKAFRKIEQKNTGAANYTTSDLAIGDLIPVSGPLQLDDVDLPIDPW
ncbi:hypothetical protein, partial [Pseudomonas aeruginosa]|uniref:hypothetical protein n=1 Tax=Pseudomonas aeruginosa TaxID=287 RepID=UPI0020945E76